MIHASLHGRAAALRLSVVELTFTLILGGCSGPDAGPDAEAAQGGTASSTPTESTLGSETTSANPTTSSTPAAAYKPATAQGPAENVPLPAMPELAKHESSEGLQAFAEYWYSLINYGFETGDVTPIQQISGAGCVLCTRIYDLLEDGYHENDWIVKGQLDVLGTQSNYVLTSKNMYQVLIQVKQDQFEYRGPNNVVYEVNEGFGAGTVHMIEATYVDGHWFANNAVIMQSQR